MADPPTSTETLSESFTGTPVVKLAPAVSCGALPGTPKPDVPHLPRTARAGLRRALPVWPARPPAVRAGSAVAVGTIRPGRGDRGRAGACRAPVRRKQR